MAISAPVSDTSRATQHEPDNLYPVVLMVMAHWPNGRISSFQIPSDQFFGRGQYGAPLPGDAVIGMITNLIHFGPPKDQPLKKVKNAKRKKPVKRSR